MPSIMVTLMAAAGWFKILKRTEKSEELTVREKFVENRQRMLVKRPLYWHSNLAFGVSTAIIDSQHAYQLQYFYI